METLKKLYIKHFGQAAETVMPIIGSGSDRTYVRLASPAGSAVGVLGTDFNENDTFIYLDRLMRERGFNAPEVFAVSSDGMAYIQQDLGDTSLFSLLHSPEGDKYVSEVMKTLPALQFNLNPDLQHLYPVKEMTREVALWDLHYYKYCFLKAAGAPMDEHALEADFRKLIDDLWQGSLFGIVYRDCQSRNVMVHDEKAWWIDFQSMRRGPVLYDAASFLWQARAGFSDEERAEYADIYYNNLPDKLKPSRREFDIMLYKTAMLRTLQVLGAYGLRGITERKAHFVMSIPGALANALALLDQGIAHDYPELARTLRAVAEQERFHSPEPGGKLKVSVFSFSYKKGYPEDLSGNGGGFMFDCRALHNPGRYDKFKPLTGRDAPVIEFLEERGEVQPFLHAAATLTDPAVERYINRGFTSLQIGFGCTGGRHRSVYCAEHLAAHLAQLFGDKICVTLTHREQNITYTL